MAHWEQISRENAEERAQRAARPRWRGSLVIKGGRPLLPLYGSDGTVDLVLRAKVRRCPAEAISLRARLEQQSQVSEAAARGTRAC